MSLRRLLPPFVLSCALLTACGSEASDTPTDETPAAGAGSGGTAGQAGSAGKAGAAAGQGGKASTGGAAGQAGKGGAAGQAGGSAGLGGAGSAGVSGKGQSGAGMSQAGAGGGPGGSGNAGGAGSGQGGSTAGQGGSGPAGQAGSGAGQGGTAGSPAGGAGGGAAGTGGDAGSGAAGSGAAGSGAAGQGGIGGSGEAGSGIGGSGDAGQGGEAGSGDAGMGGNAGSGGDTGSGGSGGQSAHCYEDAGVGLLAACPAGSVMVGASEELADVVSKQPAGATFCIQAGLHRLTKMVYPKADQRFVGEPGVNGALAAVLSGARVLDPAKFTQSGGTWTIGGQTQKGQEVGTGNCKAGHEACGLPEDLFFDNGAARLRVLTLAEVKPGAWFFDYAKQTITLGDDPTGHLVETSVTRASFTVVTIKDAMGNNIGTDVPGVVIEGLVVEKFAIPAQMGAIGEQFGSAGWTVRHVESRLNHGAGVKMGSGWVVDHCHLHHNGQYGFLGGKLQATLSSCEIDHNNALSFDDGWSAGAGKTANSDGFTARCNHVHENQGPGLWTDINNIHTLYEENLCELNDGPGIMHEISYDAVIQKNLVRNNGQKGDYVYSADILVSSSSNVTVQDNRAEVGATTAVKGGTPNTQMGIVLYQGGPRVDEATASLTGLWITANNTVKNNVVTYLAPLNNLGGGTGRSSSGLVYGDSAKSRDVGAGNTFDFNEYHAPDCAAARWTWTLGKVEASESFSDFVAKSGQDTHGSCAP
jgi:hypothetical protein